MKENGNLSKFVKEFIMESKCASRRFNGSTTICKKVIKGVIDDTAEKAGKIIQSLR